MVEKAGFLMKRIPISGPWITQKEIDYVSEAAKNAWYDQANLYQTRFEEAFCRYLGTAIALRDFTVDAFLLP